MSLIETDRLSLRPLTRDDVDDVLGIFSDPVAMRFSPAGVRNRRETAAYLERAMGFYEQHGHGFLAATLKETGAYVGHAGLLRQEVDERVEVEVAYWFLRAHWGKGLATEAATACRDYGFRVLGRERLISLIVPENAASRRVAQRIGMRLERETTWKELHVCVYSITDRKRTSP